MAPRGLLEASIRLLWRANLKDIMAALIMGSVADSEVDLLEDFMAAAFMAVYTVASTAA
jgi:hypothetical protein